MSEICSVYLNSEEGYEVISRYEAVTISGILETKSKTSLLYFIDGSDDINSGYMILNTQIDAFRK